MMSAGPPQKKLKQTLLAFDCNRNRQVAAGSDGSADTVGTATTATSARSSGSGRSISVHYYV